MALATTTTMANKKRQSPADFQHLVVEGECGCSVFSPTNVEEVRPWCVWGRDAQIVRKEVGGGWSRQRGKDDRFEVGGFWEQQRLLPNNKTVTFQKTKRIYAQMFSSIAHSHKTQMMVAYHNVFKNNLHKNKPLLFMIAWCLLIHFLVPIAQCACLHNSPQIPPATLNR